MNFTNIAPASSFAAECYCMNPLVWTEDYLLEKSIFLLLAVTILMNGFVIMAVKTRHELQTKHNILLSCLAGTDLLVGVIVQPSFVVAEILVMNGLSLDNYCRYFHDVLRSLLIPFAASLFHLALLSAERYVAMKFSLRYSSIVTTTRIKSAVICSWLISILSALPLSNFKIVEYIVGMTYFVCRIFTLVTIVYCHFSVYVVTRRHEKRIQTEQVSPESSAKFLREKKALRTTTIIIGVLLVCYLPLVVAGIVNNFVSKSHYVSMIITLAQPVFLSFTLLNSLCNPIIYCCRNKTFRKAVVELL